MNDEVIFTEEQLSFLKKVLTPYCCHVSGLHDPVHFKEKQYVCEKQKAKCYDRLRELLGFGAVTVDEPVPAPGCYWCERAAQHIE